MTTHKPHGRGFSLHQKGFTLIECLVVVVIISILAALLLSSQKKVLEYANKIRCTSRMRNFASAVNAYAADNGGILPPSAYGGEGNGEVAQYLMPYLGLTYTPAGLTRVMNTMECTATSWRFGFNSYLSKRPVAVVERPADHIYAIDLHSGRWLDSSVLGYKTGDLTKAVPKPHGGQVDVMFMDGHCEIKKASEIMRAQITRNSTGYTATDETTAIAQPAYDK